jgi:hypothetical protein
MHLNPKKYYKELQLDCFIQLSVYVTNAEPRRRRETKTRAERMYIARQKQAEYQNLLVTKNRDSQTDQSRTLLETH